MYDLHNHGNIDLNANETDKGHAMAVGGMKKKRIIEMFVAFGLIKENSSCGLLNEHNMATFLARQLHLPYIEIEKQLVDRESLRTIPTDITRR